MSMPLEAAGLSPTLDELCQLLHAVPDALIVANAAQQICVFNAVAEEVFGYAAADILGQPLERLLPDASRQRHHARLTELAAGPDIARPMTARCTVLGRHQSGREFPVEISIATHHLPDRLWFTASVRNVNARLRMEAELRASETRQSPYWMSCRI